MSRRWRERHGSEPSESDIDDLYNHFVQLQLEVIDDFTRLVPGLLDVVGVLRSRGVAIGAARDTFAGSGARYRACRGPGIQARSLRLYRGSACGTASTVDGLPYHGSSGTFPPSVVVKVGDTVPDIGEGLAAGAWSIGVLRSSSHVGCTEEEWDALPHVEQVRRVASCREMLLAAGAHAVVETLAELPELLDALDARLGRGEKP